MGGRKHKQPRVCRAAVSRGTWPACKAASATNSHYCAATKSGRHFSAVYKTSMINSLDVVSNGIRQEVLELREHLR